MDPARPLRALAWLIAAVVVALGAAGVVAGGDHPPTDTTRPELTARGDAAVRPRLAALVGELEELQRDVAALGREGRQALASLTGQDSAGLERAIADGDALIARVESRAARISAALGALPFRADSSYLSEDVRGRMATLGEAVEGIRPLRSQWASLTAGALPAVRVIDLIRRHDAETFAATTDGTRARYASATRHLRSSLGLLRAAERLRDRIGRTADVAVLSDWLARDRTYDEALLKLYTLLQRSNGKVTPASRAAFAEVQAAQRSLPRDPAALTVALGDIAEAGLNQAVIAIETARGNVAAAVAALH